MESHARDFDAIRDVASLTRLALRTPKVNSLESLAGHQRIAIFTMHFGGIRDLVPLAHLPKLRGLELYRVRKFDTGDLDVIGDFRGLEALSLGALPNVQSLRALTRGPGTTLRFLTLERLTGLATLSDLARCERLEQLGLYDSRPADKRLDVLLRSSSLDHLVVGDVYPKVQVEAMRQRFGGGGLHYRREIIRGDWSDVRVGWWSGVDHVLADLRPSPQPVPEIP